MFGGAAAFWNSAAVAEDSNHDCGASECLQFYGHGGVGAFWLQLPDYEGVFVNASTAAPFPINSSIDSDPGSDPGVGVDLTAGTVLTRHGEHGTTRIEGHLSYSRVEGKFSTTLTDAAGGVATVGWLNIDGSTPVDIFNVTGTTAPISVSRDTSVISADILWRREFEGAEDSRFSLFGGPSVINIDQEFDVSANDQTTGATMRLREDLDATYYGGTVGVEAQHALTESFSISGSLGLALYRVDADYSGIQNRTGGVAPGTSTLSLSKKEFSFAARANIEASQTLSFGTFGLVGRIDYLDKVPVMDYVTPGETLTGTPRVRAAELEFDNAWAYYLGAQLSIPLQ